MPSPGSLIVDTPYTERKSALGSLVGRGEGGCWACGLRIIGAPVRLQRFELFTNGEGGAEQGVGSALPLAGTYEYPGREFLWLPPRAHAVFR
jgi:hypothetical protein